MQPLPPPKRRPAQLSSGARDHSQPDTRPPVQPLQGSNTSGPPTQDSSNLATLSAGGPKKRKHRGGRRRKNRRQSFAAPSETSAVTSAMDPTNEEPLIEESRTPTRGTEGFYRRRNNRSDESLESDALLDHRDQPSIRARRESRLTPMPYGQSYRQGLATSLGRQHSGNQHRRSTTSHDSSADEANDDEATDKTPLIAGPMSHRSPQITGYGLFKTKSRGSSSSRPRNYAQQQQQQASSFPKFQDESEYDINNPPSVPNSPHLRSQFDDPMIAETDYLQRSPVSGRNPRTDTRDTLIDIDDDDTTANGREVHSAPPSPRNRPDIMQRGRTITLPGEGDVCFPGETMSEMADDDFERAGSRDDRTLPRRSHRKREWPQLWVLDEWSREEKEERAAGERRTQTVREPVFIEGRLRASKTVWHRPQEDVPYRYTYFNEEFESTIHAQTISELIQPGGTFRELFIPDPPILDESSDSESDTEEQMDPEGKKDSSGLLSPKSHAGTENGAARDGRLSTLLAKDSRSQSQDTSGKQSVHGSGERTPQNVNNSKKPKPTKYGPRPTFWLDVNSPTEQEMRILSRSFGIHALTSEDIMMQEAREKVELFKNYYFINYRTFEQDTNNEDYLEPINMYVCVFRYGIISFHFSQIPHPANVRRRIRQLTDYLILSADWISYAIIDDITDVYQPLIHNIEVEVDDIDDLILTALQSTNELAGQSGNGIDTKSDAGGESSGTSGIDILRRIGECRKKVMSLYRLLGNKADVIKGFAKRCNEQWDVAPRSEIGLYLGDIQDHILTMTSNLSHYETLLSRAHSNYLAQVSIRMNERQEKTSDVLGKLTVLGTIVLPMNIICGMWGMNVKVPGQDIDNLWWFWGITAGLILFALTCFLWCKRVYGIV